MVSGHGANFEVDLLLRNSDRVDIPRHSCPVVCQHHRRSAHHIDLALDSSPCQALTEFC